jgi:hypothetical protein
MFHRTNTQDGSKRKLSNKLIAGFAALIVTTMITAGGFAAATSANNGKPSKEECRAAGYTNYGQCVREWAHSHNPNNPGHGYGGGNDNSIITNISLALNNSNNNVIQVIINIFR